MKKNIILFALVGVFLATMCLNGCSPDYETDFEVKSLVVPDKSLSPVFFNIEGGESMAMVETNVPMDKWTASSNAEWLKVEKQDGKVKIAAGSNDIYTVRVGRVTIEYGHQSYDIVVTQFGKESSILVDGKRQGVIRNVSSTQKELKVNVASNLKLDNIIVPDTISWVHLVPQSVAVDGGVVETLTFNLDANTDTIPRFCDVILQSSDNYDYITTFTIVQAQRGYIIEAADSVKNLLVPATGELITIPFNINGPVGKSYTLEVEESTKDWILAGASTRALRPGTAEFNVLPNIVEQPRVGHITFTSTDPSENSSFVVTITQEKFIPVPPQNVLNPTTTAGAGFITVGWTLPVNLNYTKLTISYFDKVFKEQVVKTITDNKLTQFKVDKTFTAAGVYNFIITTYGPTGMETETPVNVSGTSDAMPDYFKVNLTAAMLSSNAQEPNEGPIKNLVDGNTNTFFHTLWSSSISQLHFFQIKLEKSMQNFDYNFYTRAAAANQAVKRMKIEVSSNGTTWSEVAVHSYPLASAGAAKMDGKPESSDNPFTYMRFTPLARQNADPIGNSWFNMSEFNLFEKGAYSEAWAGAQL
ncbi:MAG: BACON domain-containing protein [Candidatus Saccharimonadaceae bacterium]